MELTPAQISWIEENRIFFTSNIKPTQELIQELFTIYSHVDGKTHKPTGCGRCIASARNRVWFEYQKIQN